MLRKFETIYLKFEKIFKKFETTLQKNIRKFLLTRKPHKVFNELINNKYIFVSRTWK